MICGFFYLQTMVFFCLFQIVHKCRYSHVRFLIRMSWYENFLKFKRNPILTLVCSGTLGTFVPILPWTETILWLQVPSSTLQGELLFWQLLVSTFLCHLPAAKNNKDLSLIKHLYDFLIEIWNRGTLRGQLNLANIKLFWTLSIKLLIQYS